MKSKSELDKIANEIFFLEREIADLKYQFVNYPIKLQNEDISKTIQEKCERLEDLKKRQKLLMEINR